jgi:hypothetical protein
MTQTMPITLDGACNQEAPPRCFRHTRLEGTLTGNELAFAIEGQTQMGNMLIVQLNGMVEGDFIQEKVLPNDSTGNMQKEDYPCELSFCFLSFWAS